MVCPRCKHQDTCVVDSRDLDLGTIRRRRECSSCEYRFTTYERLEAIKLQVIKKDGTGEPYNRIKIVAGIKLATEKLNVTDQKIEEIVDCVEREILSHNESVVPSSKIGKIVLKQLRDLDEVAYLRFSSVYKNFSTLKSFEKELAKLGNK